MIYIWGKNFHSHLTKVGNANYVTNTPKLNSILKFYWLKKSVQKLNTNLLASILILVRRRHLSLAIAAFQQSNS